MTKAERIFEEIYMECREHAKKNGFERNPDGTAIGYANISGEVTCQRTWNAIQKLIDKEDKRLKRYEELIGTSDRHENKKFALEMVQTTLNNTIRREKEFKEWLEA